MAEQTIYKKLLDVQTHLKSPKSQYNKFGDYAYRSAEDIEAGVKPLLSEKGLVLTITDDIRVIEANEGKGRVYVIATAKVTDVSSGQSVEVSAFAREPLSKKGMDDSQVTGTASSYARKYALNGLFLCDDVQDSDAYPAEEKKKEEPTPDQIERKKRNEAVTRLTNALSKWCQVHEADYETARKGVKERPDFEDTAEFYNRAAYEFESDC